MTTPPLVTVVGLGPAGPEHRSAAVEAALFSGAPVLLRTARHPGAEALVAVGAEALDACYEEAPTFEAAYTAIVEAVVARAAKAGRVVYAVPGSPAVLERTVELLRADPRVRAEVLPGLSFLELAFDRLGIDPVTAHVRLVDAASFAVDAAGDPGPFLVAQTWSALQLGELKCALDEPPAAPVTLLHHLGLPDEVVVEVDWSELDRTLAADHLTCCYVPALASPVASELTRLVELVAVLRERCPWDREQTHESLVRHLLEETYEAIEAIEGLGPDPGPVAIAHLEEELGDLLVQVFFHARLAAEEGRFDLADVARTCHDKLVHRHPHVFGGVEGVGTADAVVSRWEAIKQAEKGRDSLMDGIPPALPALALVAKLERKAGGVGLGAEETGESPEALADELRAFFAGEPARAGELLFAIARRAAEGGVDPEEALRRTAGEWRARFVRAERAAADAGEPFTSASPAQRLVRWAESQGPAGGDEGEGLAGPI